MNIEHKPKNIEIVVSNIRFKALMWWRSLSPDMKLTMVHNPNVNKSVFNSVKLISKSSIQVERMFKNWLGWEIDVKSVSRLDSEHDEHPRFIKVK